MAAAVKGRCVAAEEISWHQHFQRALLAIRGGFHAFDRPFLDDVKIFGRIAFTEDDVIFSITSFLQLRENALTILRAQNVEQGHVVKQTVSGDVGPFT